MSVIVKCTRGKCQMRFDNLKEGDIKSFDCMDNCKEDESPSESKQDIQPEILSAETPAQKRARVKAEKKAAIKIEEEKQKTE
jgi:hypothetical protein